MDESDKSLTRQLLKLMETPKQRRGKEISDVRKHTLNLGIIGRVKYVQNNQDKYPELMKLGYHDMREVL